jgi:hypothetical protein
VKKEMVIAFCCATVVSGIGAFAGTSSATIERRISALGCSLYAPTAVSSGNVTSQTTTVLYCPILSGTDFPLSFKIATLTAYGYQSATAGGTCQSSTVQACTSAFSGSGSCGAVASTSSCSSFALTPDLSAWGSPAPTTDPTYAYVSLRGGLDGTHLSYLSGFKVTSGF